MPTDTPSIHIFHLATLTPPHFLPSSAGGKLAQFVHARPRLQWLSEPATSGRHGDGHVTSAAEAAAAAASSDWQAAQWRF